MKWKTFIVELFPAFTLLLEYIFNLIIANWLHASFMRSLRTSVCASKCLLSRVFTRNGKILFSTATFGTKVISDTLPITTWRTAFRRAAGRYICKAKHRNRRNVCFVQAEARVYTQIRAATVNNRPNRCKNR